MTQLSIQAATEALQMANYLGTGDNPHLIMTLSANGPGWKSYSIDYGHEGSIPYGSSLSNGWSSWNVYDTTDAQNYYGTITISSDNSTVEWDSYTAPSPATGYYLDGLHLTWDKNSNAFNMTVDKIYQATQENNAGPFPDAPRATPAKFQGTDTAIELTTDGSKIIDNNGREIILKGVVRPSLEWNNQGQYLSPSDIENMAKWGSNVIRLDLYQQYWFDSESADVKGSYKQIIDAIIYYATENQMAVILDLHWTDHSGQSPMANNDSLRFWSEVADAYKGFGTVIFELFNEPNSISSNIWLNGDNTYVGYQELYDTVRRNGANNLVIINGLDYAYDLSFVNDSFRVNGTNIIYGSHPYNNKGAKNYTGQGGSFENSFKGVLGKYPLIFTEFGGNQASEYPEGWQEVYGRILAYAQTHGIHYTGFAWWVDASQPQFPTLISDWDGAPVNGGILVQQDTRRFPGTQIFQMPENALIEDKTKSPSVAPQLQLGFIQRREISAAGKVTEETELLINATCSIM